MRVVYSVSVVGNKAILFCIDTPFSIFSSKLLSEHNGTQSGTPKEHTQVCEDFRKESPPVYFKLPHGDTENLAAALCKGPKFCVPICLINSPS